VIVLLLLLLLLVLEVAVLVVFSWLVWELDELLWFLEEPIDWLHGLEVSEDKVTVVDVSAEVTAAAML